MKVELYWIRHGESCTNVIGTHGQWWEQYKRLLFYDPPVTATAAQQIRTLARRPPTALKGLKQVDLVLSSPMLRALETALYLFPRRPVVAVPSR